MTRSKAPEPASSTVPSHSHVFLGVGHGGRERRTWAVIGLCGAMMIGEIIGGLLFGSIALVADGLHMSTHAGALLLAALAYVYSRKYAEDARFSFGTGKLGDLAGFTSAIVLAMIALLIGFEALQRFVRPVPIHFNEAIPIASIGLLINLASAWLLSAGGHHHHHGHGHDHSRKDHDHQPRWIKATSGALLLEVFEDGVPPRFHLWRKDAGPIDDAGVFMIETIRPSGERQHFSFRDAGPYLESVDEIPEPHDFTATLKVFDERHVLIFEEHSHGPHTRDNNMRAAIVHVFADAAVSVLVIVGLVLGRIFGWLWMDPMAGVIGALVIASWSYGLIRDTGAILLDMNPDKKLTELIRRTVEASGDVVADLHLWRLGPGHLGAILSVASIDGRDERYYRSCLSQLPSLSHVTVEMIRG